MRERHDRVSAGLGVVGAEVEIDRHPLLCARRCVIEGTHVVDPHPVVSFGGLPMADPQRETRLCVPSVPDIAEVYLKFTGKEELMRRREDCDRTVLAPGDGEPVACPKDVWLPSLGAGSIVLVGSV